jgi:hypothetical protein
MKHTVILSFLAVFIAPSLLAVKIISFGESCTVASALRALGIRTEAYPFDWNITRFRSLSRCLQDDFVRFFIPQTLKIRADKQGVTDYYGIEFVHDFPTQITTIMHEEDTTQAELCTNWRNFASTVHQKYMRRVSRLRNTLLSSEKIYIIRHFGTTKEQAIQLRDLLHRSYPNADITIVIVDNAYAMQEAWNEEGIYNFFLDDSKEWNNLHRWREIFNTLGII